MVWNVDYRTGLQIPELFFGPHLGTFSASFSSHLQEIQKIMSTHLTLRFFSHSQEMGENMSAQPPDLAYPERGPEKSSGICRHGWGFKAKLCPDLIFKSGPKHPKWAKMGPESTVWVENRSRSMPGPLRSVGDESNPLQGAFPGQEGQKVCPQTARNRMCLEHPSRRTACGS